ncbi:CD59 glycoprotein [Neosynchiropus ocellatus]
MKLLVLAVTVALLFTAGDALRCYNCQPPADQRNCEVTEETCPAGKNACTAVTFLTDPYISYQNRNTMKLLVLTVTVALLFAAGEALTCYRCIPKQAGLPCELSEETCKPGKDACASAKFLSSPFGQYQKCMAMSDCNMLRMNSFIDMKCCAEDLCNTF